jgi:hypothetical protein
MKKTAHDYDEVIFTRIQAAFDEQENRQEVAMLFVEDTSA